MSERHDATASRRTLLATGAAAVGALALGRRAWAGEDEESPAAGKLPITIAGYPYDRVRALQDGRAGVEGCDVTFVEDAIGPLNTHVFQGPRTRDVTEVGLLPFLLAWCNGDFRDYQLLPIAALRTFRHKSIFIRTDRGIEKPEDLKGRRVATVGYSSSGLTWIRGILQSEYGVSPKDIHWVNTRTDSGGATTGGVSKWEKQVPEGLDIESAPEGKDDSDLLIEGAVDAIFHPAEPRAIQEGRPNVDRLFADHRSVERAYYEKTGVFPIMHVVAIRRDTAQAHPWLPKAVFEGYVKAKRLDYEHMHKWGGYYSSLPWYAQEMRETQALMGRNFYLYGMAGIRKAIEVAFGYAYEQGLAKRLVKVEEIFHPASLDLSEPMD